MTSASPTPRRPLQFGIGTLLGLAAAVSLVFGTLRWMGVEPWAGMIVLAILIVSFLAAIGLIVAIDRSTAAPANSDDESQKNDE
jgi:hypothetical protein